MKLKVICWLLACAIFISTTALPMDVYATNAEATAGQATEPTTETEATEATTEATTPTEQTKPDDGLWHVSDEMLAVLKKMEGFYNTCYWDYKQYSIGYGSRCPEPMGAHANGQSHTITDAYAEELLRGELDYFEREVNDFIKEKSLTVTQNQYDALVSFSYNCGANWTSETTGYFHKGVLSGDLGSEFVYGMFLWSTAGGQYVLLPRRICETYMYVHGVYDYKLSWYYENDQYRYIFMDGNGGKVNYYVHGFDVNDPTAIRTQFTSAPTGPDESGAIVTYVLDGWYTQREGGTRVDILDRTITSGTVLYAHWKTPAGTPVTIPSVDTGVDLKVTVTSDGVNIRSGPQTYFASLGKVNKGDELIINEVRTAGGRQWGRAGDQWICLVDTDGKNYTDYNDLIGKLFPIWGKVTADAVNVRSGAGTGNSVVGQKNKGDQVLVKRWVSDGERMWAETDEGYIAMSYISFENDDPAEKEMVSITVQQKPNKLNYLHKTEQLDLTGASILITFNDGSSQVLTVTPEMVSGFDNTKVGINTVTVTLEGLTTEFNVEIIKAKVIFQMEDGTLISQKEYLIGDTVELPKDPEKPGDKNGTYIFTGWDKEVTVCTGNAVYTAVFKLVERVGDINKDGKINDRDAVYLLGHTLFADLYPFEGTADMNGDGKVNDRDAVYLLGYTLFPNLYPLPG